METSQSLPGEACTLTSGPMAQATGTTSRDTDARPASRKQPGVILVKKQDSGPHVGKDAHWLTDLRFQESPKVFILQGHL